MKLLQRIILIVAIVAMGNATAEACKPIAERIAEGVDLVRVVDVTHLSTSGMNLYLEVDNDTCHRLVISDAEVDVISKGEVLATISLRDKVVIKGKRSSTILVPLRFKARSSFLVARLVTRALDPDSDITLDYRMRGGIAIFRRRIEGEGVAVQELLRNSEFSASTLRGVIDIIR